jgi:hypothetical protein
MSRIVHFPNGSAIHSDIIAAFDIAVESKENINAGGSINWNSITSDMAWDLETFYEFHHIEECVKILSAEHDLNVAYDRLQVLKTDYLGMEAA